MHTQILWNIVMQTMKFRLRCPESDFIHNPQVGVRESNVSRNILWQYAFSIHSSKNSNWLGYCDINLAQEIYVRNNYRNSYFQYLLILTVMTQPNTILSHSTNCFRTALVVKLYESDSLFMFMNSDNNYH